MAYNHILGRLHPRRALQRLADGTPTSVSANPSGIKIATSPALTDRPEPSGIKIAAFPAHYSITLPLETLTPECLYSTSKFWLSAYYLKSNQNA